jgi:hypothetical protein
MADQFRNQINTARRAGYSDDELIGYLKDKDPRVTEALTQGYKPNEILEYLAPALSMGEEAVRKIGVGMRGVTEALAPVTAGATLGATAGALIGAPTGLGAPIGALAGGLAVPVTDALVMGYNRLADSNVRLPSQVISSMIPGFRAETPVERVVQSSAGALGGTLGSVGGGRAIIDAARSAPGLQSPVAQGTLAIGQEAARRPIGQLIAAPIATATGQTVTEATGSPLAGLAAGVATGSAMGLRPVKRGAVPTAEELLAQSKANYDILDKSGFQLDNTLFKQHMASLPAKLRADVGYVESVNPKVAGAFKELLSDAPKDVAEITALRKIIGGAAGSADKSERMAAMKLLDEFDTYVLNAPPSAIISGDAKAMDAWKAARADYSKVKKSELIEDIVARAEVSQGGKEPTIAQGLSALAKNDRKMRFFTAEEQDAIREAAKGGNLQSMLRTIGKFSPMTPAAAIFTAVNPYGAYTAAAGMAAKELATARRMQQVNALSSRMRLGQPPAVIEGVGANVPTFAARSIVNNLAPQDTGNAQFNFLSPE